MVSAVGRTVWWIEMATSEPEFRTIVMSDSDREFIDTMRQLDKECHDKMMAMLNIPEHILAGSKKVVRDDD